MVHSHWIKKEIYATLKAGGYTDIESWLQLVLTGSLTTYQYSDSSDVDISLFVNTKVFPEWSRAEMIGLMVENLDGRTMPGTPFPIQDFVVGKGIEPHDLYKPGLRSGYDMETGKWIVPPEKSRVHDVKAEEGGFYAYALEVADKMERLLRYEPDKAVLMWHQIHARRQRDQRAGKGDYAESNVVYKFLANRGLFPAISQASGEYIAKTASPDDQWIEEEAFKVIAQNPGIRLPQIAEKLGVMQNSLYRLLPSMENRTDIVRPSEDPKGFYTLEHAWNHAYPTSQPEVHGEGYSEPENIYPGDDEASPWGYLTDPKYGALQS